MVDLRSGALTARFRVIGWGRRISTKPFRDGFRRKVSLREREGVLRKVSFIVGQVRIFVTDEFG